MPWIDNEYGGYWEPDQSLAVRPTSPYSAVGMADESAYNDIMLQMLGYSDPNAPDLAVGDPNILRIYQDPTLRMPSWMTSANYDARGSTPAKYVTYNPGKQYILYDEAGKKVLGQAADEASYRDLVSIVNDTLVPKGRQANWRLYQVNDTTAGPGLFGPDQLLKGENGAPDRYLELVGGDLYNKSALSTIADIGLPLAAALIPGVGPAIAGALGIGGASAAAIGTALAAAGGSALSGTLQGKSIGDIAKSALLSGVGSFAGGQLLGRLGGAASKGVGSVPGGSAAFNAAFAPGFLDAPLAAGLSGALPGGLAGSSGDIIVNATRGLAPAVFGSAAGAGLGGVVGSLATSGLTPAMQADLANMAQTEPLEPLAVKPVEPPPAPEAPRKTSPSRPAGRACSPASTPSARIRLPRWARSPEWG